MTRGGQWLPSNRTAVRICTVLMRAHNDSMVDLKFNDVIMIREGVFQTRFTAETRAILARIWRQHGGLDLARRVDQYDRLPQDVIEDLNESACA